MAWNNGLYRVYGGGVRLDVRVWLGGEPELTRRVSCDLYLVTAPRADVATDHYVGSFSSAPLVTTPPSQDPLEVELTAIDAVSTGPGPTGTLKLALTGGGPGGAPVRATLTSAGTGGAVPAGPIALTPLPEQPQPLLRDALRSIELELALQTGYEPPGEAPAPALGRGRTVGCAECFREAGVAVTLAGDSPLALAAVESLAPQQLYDMTYNQGTTDSRGLPAAANPGFRAGVSTHLFLMVTAALTGDAGATGLMFDQERRGAAVFYGTLRRFFADRPGELMANYVFTLVHEVGHCLNLPHAFEHSPGWPVDASMATFMNYPQKYTGSGVIARSAFTAGTMTAQPDRDNYLRFWSTFRYEFAPEELLMLRHGARDAVYPGGLAYWGKFSGSRLPLQVGDLADTSLVLLLRLRPERPGGLFDFGEPVHVELARSAPLTGTGTRRSYPTS
jgi:hypothetical protein